MLKEISEHEVKGTCRSFTVSEPEKNRRRWILHPAWFNQSLGNLDHNVEFPTVAEIVEKAATFKHAVCCDFAGFFQQFPLDDRCGAYFAIKKRDRYYIPKTVPTGGCTPPLFAQILTQTIAKKAAAGTQCTADAFIDNVRFCGNNTGELQEVTRNFFRLASEMGITVNEKVEEAKASQLYIFLGIHFDHAKQRVHVTEKTRRKLSEMTARIGGGKTQGFDPEHCFGLLVWASTVLALPLAKYYHVFKFMRRWARSGQRIQIWPSIVEQWKRWMAAIENSAGRQVSTHHGVTPNQYTMFTDACPSGWGAVIFDFRGRHPPIILAGSWGHPHRGKHINLLELITVRMALETWRGRPEGATIALHVDNTTAIHQIRKTRSRSFLANCEIRKLLRVLDVSRCTIGSIDYVASDDNPADFWSRLLANGSPQQYGSQRPTPHDTNTATTNAPCEQDASRNTLAYNYVRDRRVSEGLARAQAEPEPTRK